MVRRHGVAAAAAALAGFAAAAALGLTHPDGLPPAPDLHLRTGTAREPALASLSPGDGGRQAQTASWRRERARHQAGPAARAARGAPAMLEVTVVGESGAPVPSAVLRPLDAGRAPVGAGVLTDRLGRAKLPRAKLRFVEVLARGFAARCFAVPAGSEGRLRLVLFRGRVLFRARAIDATTGAPVAGLRFAVESGLLRTAARSGTDGRLEFRAAGETAGDDFALRLDDPRFVFLLHGLRLPWPKPGAEVPLPVHRWAVLEVRFLDLHGKPEDRAQAWLAVASRLADCPGAQLPARGPAYRLPGGGLHPEPASGVGAGTSIGPGLVRIERVPPSLALVLVAGTPGGPLIGYPLGALRPGELRRLELHCPVAGPARRRRLRILGPRGAPVRGAEVFVYDPREHLRLRHPADGFGRLSLPAPPAGARILVRAPGCAPAVFAASTLPATVRLAPAAPPLAVAVRDRTGRPVAGLELELKPAGAPGPEPPQLLTTSASGLARHPAPMPSRSYEVTALIQDRRVRLGRALPSPTPAVFIFPTQRTAMMLK